MSDPIAPSFENLDIADLYHELKRLARAQRHRLNHPTLNTTALVHDLYLDLAGREPLRFDNRQKFYAYAAKAMRHLLVDRARAKARYKAGGDLLRVDAEEIDFQVQGAPIQDALELDSALNALGSEDERAARIVELHVFVGLPIEQIAELLALSTRTVDRDWQFARAFLKTAFQA
jgi:RNA polymerase sigma factor (TIGR02999 family)